MIVLDASALLALINNEPGADVRSSSSLVQRRDDQLGEPCRRPPEDLASRVTAEDVDAALDALSVTMSHFGRLDWVFSRCSLIDDHRIDRYHYHPRR
ncbi:hypothetical protein [Geodermatophilus sp. CPCC 206100]|uniref:hypothetical protein n=1 Tax=Geodermatophilus sp. CPCC 206100 TaxID=3020054 RepID=UPI003B00C07E